MTSYMTMAITMMVLVTDMEDVFVHIQNNSAELNVINVFVGVHFLIVVIVHSFIVLILKLR